jgi:GH15 family glucan-1,4-alpha-glucosidase
MVSAAPPSGKQFPLARQVRVPGRRPPAAPLRTSERNAIHGLARDADGGVDGLPGTEAAFLACTFWQADTLAGLRRTGEAEHLFERMLGLRNDLGLLSEEYDVGAQRQVGNTPQAFSHVGLVNTARHLSGSLAAHETGRRARDDG